MVAVALRRVLLIVMLAALGGVAWAWWRDRNDEPLDEPPSWPPLEPDAAGEPSADVGWVPANDDGSCPLTHPVKAKESSGIYHVDGGRMYARTNADRCYATTDAAEQDGYRRSKT